MLQRHGASEDVYNQIQKISENSFKYAEPEEPCGLVEAMVEQMNNYEDEDCLRGGCLYKVIY